MNEREQPASASLPDQPAPVPQPAWTLTDQALPHQDVRLGAGYRLIVGAQTAAPTEVQIYPQRRVVRVHTPALDIDVAQVRHVAAAKDGSLVVHAIHDEQATELTVQRSGELLLRHSPIIPLSAESETLPDVEAGVTPEAPEWPTDTSEGRNKVVGRNTEESGADLHPDAPQSLSETPSAPVDQEAEKHPRVTHTGRVGAIPAFRTTPKGVFIGKFPLAVRDVEEQTHWHSILAFNDRARKLQEAKLAKGQIVQVVGYEHEREQRTRDGRVKTVQEIYAVVVKSR